MAEPSIEIGPEESAINARSSLMSGVKANGEIQVGVAVDLRSSAGLSSLMIPDATKAGEGEPVYLSKPVELRLEKLTAFLKKKDVTIPTEPVDLNALLRNTKLVCGALYYSADKKKTGTEEIERPGAMLMSFAIKNQAGIIGSLTADEDLGKLFDVVGVSLRVVKCPEARLPELQAYVKELLAAPETSQAASEAAKALPEPEATPASEAPKGGSKPAKT
jgi:hypothetical protein